MTCFSQKLRLSGHEIVTIMTIICVSKGTIQESYFHAEHCGEEKARTSHHSPASLVETAELYCTRPSFLKHSLFTDQLQHLRLTLNVFQYYLTL